MIQKTTQVTLAGIEARTKDYRSARDTMGKRVQSLQDEIAAATRKWEPQIRKSLLEVKAAESELSAAVAANPGLFARPRSHTFHGVRVGIEKGKGKVTIIEKDRTVELIRKHMEDQFDLLVKTTHKPIKKAIEQLDAKDLKRIGVAVEDAGDQVVIRPVDSELDKMLNALLKTDPESIEEDQE